MSENIERPWLLAEIEKIIRSQEGFSEINIVFIADENLIKKAINYEQGTLFVVIENHESDSINRYFEVPITVAMKISDYFVSENFGQNADFSYDSKFYNLKLPQMSTRIERVKFKGDNYSFYALSRQAILTIEAPDYFWGGDDEIAEIEINGEVFK